MMELWLSSLPEVVQNIYGNNFSCTNYITSEDLEYYRFKGTAGLFCPDGTNKYAAFRFIDGPTCPNCHGNLVDLLVDGLQGRNDLSKEYLAQVLSWQKVPWGICSSKKLVEGFLAALKDKDPKMREAAGVALHQISRMSFGTDHSAWEEWWAKDADNHL